MKKIVLMVAALALLCGCAAKDMETISDQYTQAPEKPVQQVYIALPEEAASPTMETLEAGRLYLCDGYTLTLQTMASGDLEKTIRQATGFSPEKLQIIQTAKDDVQRYDCVWAAVGEDADMVCRCAVLDDGNYHYVLTSSVEEDLAQTHAEALQGIFRSFQLLPQGEQFSTGS